MQITFLEDGASKVVKRKTMDDEAAEAVNNHADILTEDFKDQLDEGAFDESNALMITEEV